MEPTTTSDIENTPRLSISLPSIETLWEIVSGEEKEEISSESTSVIVEDVSFTEQTIEEKLAWDTTPLNSKEEGFIKIEALLEKNSITDSQAEEYFLRISSGEIEKVIKELQSL